MNVTDIDRAELGLVDHVVSQYLRGEISEDQFLSRLSAIHAWSTDRRHFSESPEVSFCGLAQACRAVGKIMHRKLAHALAPIADDNQPEVTDLQPVTGWIDRVY